MEARKAAEEAAKAGKKAEKRSKKEARRAEKAQRKAQKHSKEVLRPLSLPSLYPLHAPCLGSLVQLPDQLRAFTVTF